MKNIFFITLCINLFMISSCFFEKTMMNHEGVVNFKTYVYKPTYKIYDSDKIHLPDNRVLFNESFAIEIVPGVQLGWGVKPDTVVIMYYIFYDFKKQLFYKYLNFSDTAIPVKTYTKAQAGTVIDGMTWHFYEDDFKQPDSLPQKIVEDTLIDGRNYKRIEMSFGSIIDSAHFSIITAYFDTNLPEKRFQINKYFGDKVGYPYTRVKQYGYPFNKINVIGQISFQRDYLTETERKVFKAWTKNAKDKTN